jgi:hypothetical protein
MTQTSDVVVSAPTARARSDKFRTFAITFGIAFTLLYTVYERLNWPLFTWQPQVSKLYFGCTDP